MNSSRSAILYWKKSVVGITALILLCLGDGFAGTLITRPSCLRTIYINGSIVLRLGRSKIWRREVAS